MGYTFQQRAKRDTLWQCMCILSVYRQLFTLQLTIISYTRCDSQRLFNLPQPVFNDPIVERSLICHCTIVILFYKLSALAVHVHDVVMDWSYALAEFLVSTLFKGFPWGNPSNFFHIANVFLVGFPFFFITVVFKYNSVL